VVRRELDALNARIRDMRTLKRELETLVADAEQLRAVGGDNYCPLLAHREQK